MALMAVPWWLMKLENPTKSKMAWHAWHVQDEYKYYKSWWLFQNYKDTLYNKYYWLTDNQTSPCNPIFTFCCTPSLVRPLIHSVMKRTMEMKVLRCFLHTFSTKYSSPNNLKVGLGWMNQTYPIVFQSCWQHIVFQSYLLGWNEEQRVSFGGIQSYLLTWVWCFFRRPPRDMLESNKCPRSESKDCVNIQLLYLFWPWLLIPNIEVRTSPTDPRDKVSCLHPAIRYSRFFFGVRSVVGDFLERWAPEASSKMELCDPLVVWMILVVLSAQNLRKHRCHKGISNFIR